MIKKPLAPAAPPRRPVPTGDVQSDYLPAPKKEGEADPSPEPVPNPRSRVPTEGEKGKLEKLHDDQDKRLDALFDDPAPEPPKVDVPPEPAPDPAPAPPAPKKEEDPKGEDDTNFDAPPEGAEGLARETMAQKRARENGRALEATKLQLQEQTLELNRIKEELEAAKKAPQQAAPVSRREFLSHPEISPIRQEIVADRNAVAETQTLPQAGHTLVSKFGNYVTEYITKTAEQDQTKAMAMDADLRKTLVRDYAEAYREAKGDQFDESDNDQRAEMQAGAREYTRDVLQLLVRNASKTVQIEEKIGNLMHKAREGTLAQNVEAYQFHETDLGNAMDAALNIPEKVIVENPHSVESTVATLMKQPAWKSRFDTVRKEVSELLLGPRAMTQKEMDDAANGGVDVKEFQKVRQKKYLEKRKKLAVQIAQALLLRGGVGRHCP